MVSEQKLKTRSDIHLARKLWHFSGVLLIVIIYHNISRDLALQVASLATFVFVSLDILRQHYENVNHILLKAFQPIMREHERKTLAGTTYLLTGVLLIVFLFPKDIVVLSLLFLALADPLASYVGLLYGKDKLIGNKSLQGSIAAFLTCTITAAVYFYSHNLMLERLLIVSVLSGLIGAAAELLPIGKLDDNFTLPVLSAFMLWLLFYIFGGIS